jgi:hypothetical protein
MLPKPHKPSPKRRTDHLAQIQRIRDEAPDIFCTWDASNMAFPFIRAAFNEGGIWLDEAAEYSTRKARH